MSLPLPPINIFEDLPDEVLLIICRYLSSIDILSAFYGLNTRLSQTISGYYQYVFLGQASYQRLTYMCSSILSIIGSNIHSLIVSDEWQSPVSKLFLEYFGERMSSTFPHLKRLTLIAFTPTSLKLFLNALKNLPELSELDIRLLSENFKDENESWMLLHQLFTINENRLTSISFDDDSAPFSCEPNDTNVSYPNIEKLIIKLKTLHDFHNLLTTLPRIHFLEVLINTPDFQISEEQRLLLAYELKDFSLRSTQCSWDLDGLTTVLNRIPNVENLSIRILSLYDSRLVVGHEFFSQLSTLPLKIFHYIIFYFDYSIDKTTVFSTWQQFRQESICIEEDNINGCMLYTLPFTASKINLFHSHIEVAGNSYLLKNYGEKITYLSLHNISPHIAESYIILTKCHRIKHLTITINDDVEPKLNQQIDLCKLPRLTSLLLMNTPSMEPKNFPALVEALPYLYELSIHFPALQSLFDNDFVCRLLGQRITHLKIDLDLPSVELHTFPMARLASIFPHLKCLYFKNQTSPFEIYELLILAALNHLSEWKSLISLIVSTTSLTEETCAKGIHQWVVEHISTYNRNLFLTDYTDYTFRLLL